MLTSYFASKATIFALSKMAGSESCAPVLYIEINCFYRFENVHIKIHVYNVTLKSIFDITNISV